MHQGVLTESFRYELIKRSKSLKFKDYLPDL